MAEAIALCGVLGGSMGGWADSMQCRHSPLASVTPREARIQRLNQGLRRPQRAESSIFRSSADRSRHTAPLVAAEFSRGNRRAVCRCGWPARTRPQGHRPHDGQRHGHAQPQFRRVPKPRTPPPKWRRRLASAPVAHHHRRQFPQHVERRRQVQRLPIPVGGWRYAHRCRSRQPPTAHRSAPAAPPASTPPLAAPATARRPGAGTGTARRRRRLSPESPPRAPRDDGSDTAAPDCAAACRRRRPSAPRGGRRSGGSCSRGTGTGYHRGRAGRDAERSGPCALLRPTSRTWPSAPCHSATRPASQATRRAAAVPKWSPPACLMTA